MNTQLKAVIEKKELINKWLIIEYIHKIQQKKLSKRRIELKLIEFGSSKCQMIFNKMKKKHSLLVLLLLWLVGWLVFFRILFRMSSRVIQLIQTKQAISKQIQIYQLLMRVFIDFHSNLIYICVCVRGFAFIRARKTCAFTFAFSFRMKHYLTIRLPSERESSWVMKKESERKSERGKTCHLLWFFWEQNMGNVIGFVWVCVSMRSLRNDANSAQTFEEKLHLFYCVRVSICGSVKSYGHILTHNCLVCFQLEWSCLVWFGLECM